MEALRLGPYTDAHADHRKSVGLLPMHHRGNPTPIFDFRVATAWRSRGVGRAMLCWFAQHVFTVPVPRDDES